MAVDPMCRRRGLARFLTQLSVHVALALGGDVMLTSTAAMWHVYRELGFRAAYPNEFLFPDGEDSNLLVRRVNDPSANVLVTDYF
jgi:ribosomal protein S18 acetylase RimI-like enzyme